MKAVGGYFELELSEGSEYHSNAIKLNSGRNALRYVLEAGKYRRIYLPLYGCDVLLEPIANLRLEFEFYAIDRNFEPEFDFSKLAADDCFLYTNYFGLKDDFVKSLAAVVCENLIVDNAQAFFSPPVENAHVFYSPRKFFGVADGGYLYTSKTIERELAQDVSLDRMKHLLVRSDKSAEDGYAAFLENEKTFADGDLRSRSALTGKILKSIDYERVRAKRRKNFSFLQENLKDLNRTNLEINREQAPLCYPFYAADGALRKRLIENKIYAPQYWANVLKTAASSSIEYDYAKNLIHLPIDQRVTDEDLERIIETIKL